MKRFLLFYVVILLASCEDKKSRPINTNNNPIVHAKDTIIKKIPAKKTKSFPVLNKKNIMDFLLEYDKKNPENKVRITTDFGTIDLLLYNETKFHRSNFIFLTKQGYFEGTQFYRVVKNFVIQGGNTDDPKIMKKRTKIGNYLLPVDIKPHLKHHRGVISMPSSNIENPYKHASPFEFFIVQQQGGAHHLNGNYTVFGKVIKGMDVVDKIASQKTDASDWPLHNIYISKVEILN